MMRIIVLSTLMLFLGTISKAQNVNPTLDATFVKSEIISIDTRAILKSRNSDKSTFNFDLKIDGKVRTLQLTERYLFGEDYQVTLQTATGREALTEHQKPLPTFGHVLGDLESKVTLTINNDFLFGRITLLDAEYFIEPLSYYDKSAANGQFVLYNVEDVKPGAPMTCGVNHSHVKNPPLEINGENRSMMNCYEVEWAIANDFLMFQRYNTVAGVENHAIGVANDVQTNYDDEFNDELQLLVIEQFVSNCSTCDPWTSSTNSGTLLNSFTSWNNSASGFTFNNDVASLWSARNFNGSTIGLAWVGTVCRNNRTHVLEDFSSNGNLKRVLVAHEMGHNFDSFHDGGGGFIMSPSVNTSTTWSAQSRAAIQNYYNSQNCFSACPPSGSAPIPDFTLNYIDQCAPGFVEFTDASLNTPTTWDWTFEGGTPGTASNEFPDVTYNSPGLYSVTLTVSNAVGSNTMVFNDAVEIFPTPFANFVFTVNGLTVSFDNISTDAVDYFWTFGDGNFSGAPSPTHTYAGDGTYSVNLQAINGICDDNYTVDITVVSAPSASISSDVTSGCLPFDVTYSGLSSGNAVAYEWLFEGGTPGTSTEPEPVVSYDVVGTYDTRLIVTNSGGLKDTLELNDYITVNDVPTASYTYTQSGLEYTFTNTSTNYTSLSWDFGDGTTSNDTNPTHTYAQAGDYTVVLTTMSPCGMMTDMQLVDVEVAPNALINANFNGGDVLCRPYDATFTAGEQNNLDTYNWTFEGGDPMTSTNPNPTVNYSAAGTYDVTLIVSNNLGEDTLTLSDYVTISDVPNTEFVFTRDLLSVSFNNTTIDGTNYLWDFGDGNTSNALNPVHTYAVPGTYTVSLTGSNTCGDSEFEVDVVVNALPSASFTSDTTNGCVPFNVSYTNMSSSNATSFSWTFEGGNPSSSTDENPTVMYMVEGQYNVQLIVSNAEGSDTLNFMNYVDANGIPAAGLVATVADDLITLTDLSVESDSAVFLFEGAVVMDNPVRVNGNGMYEVGIIATNDCGVDTAYATAVVSAFPEASFTSGDAIDCGQVDVRFTSGSLNANSFEWTFENGNPATSTDENPVVRYTESGTYNVTLVASNALGSSSQSMTIDVEVLTGPVADFTTSIASNEVDFVYAGTVVSQYEWDFGDGASSSEANPSHTYSSVGDYEVVLIVTDDCGRDTISQIVSITVVDVNDLENIVGIKVYPNPANNILNIEFDGPVLNDLKLSLLDLQGRLILNQNQGPTSKGIVRLDLQEVIQGTYILRLQSKDKISNKKVIILK